MLSGHSTALDADRRRPLRAALSAAMVLALLFSAMPTVLARGAGDEVTIILSKTDREYKITCRYVADGTRFILLGVTDTQGKGHRVSRRTVKGGSGTFTWKGRVSRFGRLVRACAAMHSVEDDQPTTASDCKYF